MPNANANPDETTTSVAETEDLQESIDSLERRISFVNSNRMVFVRGIVGGLGRAVGATIIFALILGGLSALLYQLGWFPDFNEFILRFRPGPD